MWLRFNNNTSPFRRVDVRRYSPKKISACLKIILLPTNLKDQYPTYIPSGLKLRTVYIIHDKKGAVEKYEYDKYSCILTFDKGHELLLFDLDAGHVNLESEEHSECELVLLIEASHRVAEHLKRHEVYDVCNTLGRDGRLGGSIK